ncbi:MAG: T9SS type A sorting domain-containing protein [Chitinophagales bacterium]|nr:T9SS type A sorting domain-containing protein [Chitinophagales bacterium]
MKKTSTLVFTILFLFPALLSAQCFVGPTCLQDTVPVGVTSNNDSSFWNDLRFWYPGNESRDLPEGPADIRLRLIDTCAAANLAFVLRLNVKGDSTLAVHIDSDSTYSNGFVRFAPAFGGEEVRFDNRPVPDNQRYRFKLQQAYTQDTLEARLRFNTAQNPNQYVLPQLPLGTHKLYWFSKDSAGVRDTLCVQTIVVKDTKAPVVACKIGGLSVNLTWNISGTFATMYLQDFLQYTEDNVTNSDLLQLSLVRSVESLGSFPLDNSGLPINFITFDCDDKGLLLLQVWSKDQAGNTDFCETYLWVDDSDEACALPQGGDICIETISGIGVPYKRVNITTTLLPNPPLVTPFPDFLETAEDGCVNLSFNALTTVQEVTLTPVDSSYYLNGVSTADLLLISRYILGIDTINNPYSLIAADANKSGTITTADIIDLRRLILGVYSRLPLNSSWRFVMKNHVFPNPGNPFIQAFPESYYSNKPIQDLYFAPVGTPEMIAIKIGDMNGNANPYLLQHDIPEDRNLYDTLTLMMPRAQSGELVPVYFEKARLEGFQWSLQNVEPEQIVPGPGLAGENFAWSAEQRTLRCSWISADASAQDFDTSRPICWLKLKQAPVQLENGFDSEAYEAGAAQRVIGFKKSELMYNKNEKIYILPNPTRQNAWIQGDVAQAGNWVFQVTDASGKVIWNEETQLEKGAFQREIPGSVLSGTGVYFWTAHTSHQSFNGKLVKF